ncbi:MAG: hypothetical protein IT384_06705 [Deltaproteobacteria bacterium]|nr:hypothetical protein [Deltaproteobacteria bacterium]
MDVAQLFRRMIIPFGVTAVACLMLQACGPECNLIKCLNPVSITLAFEGAPPTQLRGAIVTRQGEQAIDCTAEQRSGPWGECWLASTATSTPGIGGLRVNDAADRNANPTLQLMDDRGRSFSGALSGASLKIQEGPGGSGCGGCSTGTATVPLR